MNLLYVQNKFTARFNLGPLIEYVYIYSIFVVMKEHKLKVGK